MAFSVKRTPFKVASGFWLSRGVTLKVKVTGFALWLALSVALKVIVLGLPTSPAVVLILIVNIFSVSVFFS